MGLKNLFNTLRTNRFKKQMGNALSQMMNNPNANHISFDALDALGKKPNDPIDPIKILLTPIMD